MGVAALLPGLISVAGGIIGNAASSGSQQSAYDTANQAYQKLIDIGAPPDLAKQVVLQQYQQAGTLTPELEQYINAGPSQAAQVKDNTSLQNAQMNALSQLAQYSQAGVTPQEAAQLASLQAQERGAAQAKQNQILQQMQERGLNANGSTGAELAARLSGAQSAANTESLGALQNAGQASQNALNALNQYGQLAGNIRQQDFGNQMATANAADAFRKFDVQNQLGVQAANTNAQNQANLFNLENKQNVSNMNTQQANAEAVREAQAQQQQWEDSLQRAQAQEQGLLGQAGVDQSQANATNNLISGLFSGLGSAVGSYKTNQASNNLLNMLSQNQNPSSSSLSSEIGSYQLPDYSNVNTNYNSAYTGYNSSPSLLSGSSSYNFTPSTSQSNTDEEDDSTTSKKSSNPYSTGD